MELRGRGASIRTVKNATLIGLALAVVASSLTLSNCSCAACDHQPQCSSCKPQPEKSCCSKEAETPRPEKTGCTHVQPTLKAAAPAHEMPVLLSLETTEPTPVVTPAAPTVDTPRAPISPQRKVFLLNAALLL